MHHPGDAPLVPRGHQEVDVIGHEHVSVDVHAKVARGLLQAAPKETKIGLAAKDRLPVVPAVDHVDRTPGMEMSCRPAHSILTTAARGGWPQSRPKWCLAPFLVYWCLAPFWLVAGCQVIDPHNMIGRQMGEATPVATEFVPSPPPATLGKEARTRAFDFVWSTIDEHYYDPSLNGVDWKAVRERYRPMALAA